MKKLRDFKCTKGSTFERFVYDAESMVMCKCGEMAKRLVSAPKCFQNTTGKSPSVK